MALPRSAKESEVVVKNVTSTPYLQMTLEVLKQFEVKVKHKNFETFNIDAAQTYVPQNIAVPGDWSGAAFLMVAAALCADGSEVVINNLSTTITQADAQIVKVLELAGIAVIKTKDSFHIQSATVNAFEFDANQCPDLFPPLAALAAFANSVSTIYGIKRLVHKESNRAKVLQEEFAKANIRITLRDDEMKIYPSAIRPAIINAHNDHRIAMAAAILGLAGAKMTIKGAECVAKSYPHFFEDIKSLGGKVISS
jgi:3-phosphoshikimate 1-carboxyvinyltransferase